MHTFTVEDVATLDGPEWLRRERRSAIERFLAGPMPSAADEIWRYSRIDELDLGLFPLAPAAASDANRAEAREALMELPIIGAIGAFSGLIESGDGHLVATELAPEAVAAGVTAGPAGADDGGVVGSVSDAVNPWDAFAELNRALCPAPLVIRIPKRAVLDLPIVVIHRVRSPAAVFPRTVVFAGAESQAKIIECLVSEDIVAFVAPVVELDIGEGSHVAHVVVQELGPRVWQTALHASRIGRDASLYAFTAAFGGDYARVRTDSRIVGAGGTTDLLALYFGDGAQMHDFRTLQDHEGPKSTSDLLFKGAVVGEARSAYSGLIRVRPGAAGTRAFQTNRNLVLSDTGLATYSVPNLDIEENDVSCSHASATGPIDPDQLFYLESRGIPTPTAERLIVMGFFDDLLERLPVAGLRRHLRDVVAAKLQSATDRAIEDRVRTASP